MYKKTSDTHSIQRIKRHFRKNDHAIFTLLNEMEIEPIRRACGPAGYFPKLCREIISQQLGSKGARAIVGRFLKLFPAGRPTPARALALPVETLRAVGMSWAKARSILDLAQKSAGGEIVFRTFHRAPDDAVIAELTKVKGIGRWTAEMFLIFTLGREDIFSFGDLGLRKGFTHLYGKKNAESPRRMEKISAQWSPYRSYACLALWHIADGAKEK